MHHHSQILEKKKSKRFRTTECATRVVERKKEIYTYHIAFERQQQQTKQHTKKTHNKILHTTLLTH